MLTVLHGSGGSSGNCTEHQLALNVKHTRFYSLAAANKGTTANNNNKELRKIKVFNSLPFDFFNNFSIIVGCQVVAVFDCIKLDLHTRRDDTIQFEVM